MARKKKKKPNRRIVVFGALVGVLTFTSALLLAIAPAPLNPDGSNTLLAIDTPQAMAAVFQTKVPAKLGRWKYIYVHHLRGNTESAADAGDHFVIGNGQGGADGQIQFTRRWDQQLSATPPGVNEIDAACISIGLTGDFDRNVPTPLQLQRLTSLVQALQGRLNLRSQDVLLLSQASSPAGIGRYFPVTAFREDLLP